MLLGIGVVCCNGNVAILNFVLLAHFGDTSPDQKDGNPAKGQSHHGDDSNAVPTRTALAILDIKKIDHGCKNLGLCFS